MRRRYETKDLSMETDVNDSNLDSSKIKPKKTQRIPLIYPLVCISFLLALFGFVFYLDSILPTPLLIKDEPINPDKFIAERAQIFLQRLVDLGPKVAGSYQNEIAAVELIEKEIEGIVQRAYGAQHLEVDKQIVSGSYYLGYIPDGTVNVYRNVQNIIVKLHGKNNTNGILVNAHFDSVPTSPGASDDGIMCAIMLECLRKLSKHAERLEQDVVFLFNGAEETPLQASHGFITQHPWAENLKFIVNLEAAGNGGKEILFQTGPMASMLLNIYGKVSYPFGVVMGEEIFQANLIPSDTDFRIFRDFGGLIGYDFAYVRNGYRYHTKYDSIDNIQLGTIQHGGANILTLIEELSQRTDETLALRENSIYFDVFGWFLIYYRNTIGIIFNTIVIILSSLISLLSIHKKMMGCNWNELKLLICLLFVIVFSWGCSGLVTFLIAFVLNASPFCMRWYGQPILLIGIYAAPALAIQTLITVFFNDYFFKRQKTIEDKVEIQIHLMRLIFTAALLVGTSLNIRASYGLMILILFNLLAHSFKHLLPRLCSGNKIYVFYYFCLLFPVMYFMYLAISVSTLFIPIMGRSGAGKNSELLLGLLTLLLTIIITTFYIPIASLIKRPYSVPLLFFATFAITMILVVTPLTFPYSGNATSPTPQRFMIYHTQREHTDANGSVVTKSGIFMLNMDRNSPASVRDFVPELNQSESLENDCKLYPACGMPISHVRMLASVKDSTWIPFDKPSIDEPTSLRLISSDVVSSKVKRFTFKIQGPDHSTIFIRPKANTTIIYTSLADVTTDGFLFINYVYGLTKADLEFTINCESDFINRDLIDIVVSGKYFTSLNFTSEFKRFLESFPNWADLVATTADYKSFVF